MSLKVDFICCALYCMFTNLDRPTPNPTVDRHKRVFRAQTLVRVDVHKSFACTVCLSLIFLCSLFFYVFFPAAKLSMSCQEFQTHTQFTLRLWKHVFRSVMCWSYLVHTIYGKTFGKDKNRFRHDLHGNTCWRMLREARKMGPANASEPARSNKNGFTWCPDRWSPGHLEFPVLGQPLLCTPFLMTAQFPMGHSERAVDPMLIASAESHL